MLKVVVVGYDKMFSSILTGALEAGHSVVGAFRTDRVKFSKFALFFKDIFAPSRDFSFMKSYNIYDISATSVNSPEFAAEIKKLGADIILVGSWSEKFKKPILNLPEFGCVNCHPSLLPANRGANPYFWAIYQGKTKTGVTFHLMDEGFDTGKILRQMEVEITKEMTAGDLKDKTCIVAKSMVGELLSELETGMLIPIEQNEKNMSYENAYTFEYVLIDFERKIEDVNNHIRALLPVQPPYCRIGGWFYRIKNHRIYDGKRAYKKNHVFKCVDGEIEVEI